MCSNWSINVFAARCAASPTLPITAILRGRNKRAEVVANFGRVVGACHGLVIGRSPAWRFAKNDMCVRRDGAVCGDDQRVDVERRDIRTMAPI